MDHIVKKIGVDFHHAEYSSVPALTLSPDCVGENNSGWVIKGEVSEDYYSWVNDFVANHPELGSVWGNFEHEVKATSEEAFSHFYKHHEPKAWDYGDI